jgi:hypothetical protein
VRKKPAKVCVNAGFVVADEVIRKATFATQTPSHQSCEATNRNLIQGRYDQVSQPNMSETISFGRIGKSRACAAKVSRLIQGKLPPRSGSRASSKAGWDWGNSVFRVQLTAEVVVLNR